MKKITISILSALFLTGCETSTPGTMSTSTSKFDGTQQVRMEPGWIYDGILGSSMKLGGYWNDKMGDNFVMVAVYHGTDSIRALSFNIDGEIETLTPSDTFTDFERTPGYAGSGIYIPGSNWSSQRFDVPLAFAQKLVTAKKVMVKMSLSKSFVEGEFKSGMTMAKPAFIKFLAKVEQVKSTQPKDAK